MKNLHSLLMDRRLGETIKIAVLILLFIIALESRAILGWITGSNTPVAVVEGYSMFPLLRQGDLVFAYKPQPRDIHVGDIVIYRGYGGELIIHRVIAVKTRNGNYYYVTKGDNNRGPDIFEFRGNPGIPYSRIEGKVWGFSGGIFKLPYIGYLSIWFHRLLGR